MPTTSDSRRKKTTLITFIGLTLVLLVASLMMVAPYLLTVTMGGILALISRPLYLKLRNRQWGPKTAALTVTLAVCLLVIAPLGFFTVAAIDQATDFGKQVSESKSITMDSVHEWVSRWKPLRVVIGDPSEIDKQIRSGLQKMGTITSQAVLGIFGSLPDQVLQLFLAIASCFFFLVDGNRFYPWMRDRIPLDADVRQKIFKSFKDTAISSLLATICAAGVQALLMLVTFIVLGLPAGFLAAGVTFICAWIPFLGSMPVAAAAAIYLYTQGEMGKLVAMIVMAIVIGISDNITRPAVLGGRDEMHPLVGLVAIFGGIAMFGLFGVFFGPILVALLLAVLEIWPSIQARFDLVDTANVPLVDEAGNPQAASENSQY